MLLNVILKQSEIKWKEICRQEGKSRCCIPPKHILKPLTLVGIHQKNCFLSWKFLVSTPLNGKNGSYILFKKTGMWKFFESLCSIFFLPSPIKRNSNTTHSASLTDNTECFSGTFVVEHSAFFWKKKQNCWGILHGTQSNYILSACVINNPHQTCCLVGITLLDA